MGLVKRHALRASVGEVMEKKRVPKVRSGTPITECIPFPFGRHHVWVVDADDRVVGVVTEHDLLDFLTPPNKVSPVAMGVPKWFVLSDAPIDRIMTKKLVVTSASESVLDVVRKMKTYNIRRVPVVSDDGRLVGEVCISDIVRRYIKELSRS